MPFNAGHPVETRRRADSLLAATAITVAKKADWKIQQQQQQQQHFEAKAIGKMTTKKYKLNSH